MDRAESAAGQLLGIAHKLQERGQPDLATEVIEILAALQGKAVPEPDGGVMTTGEAATILGIRSVNTVKRWAREGTLEGFRRGGRILVSRSSVERLRDSPSLAEQRAKEEAIAENVAGFDAGDQAIPKTRWVGRRPWADRPAETVDSH